MSESELNRTWRIYKLKTTKILIRLCRCVCTVWSESLLFSCTKQQIFLATFTYAHMTDLETDNVSWAVPNLVHNPLLPVLPVEAPWRTVAVLLTCAVFVTENIVAHHSEDSWNKKHYMNKQCWRWKKTFKIPNWAYRHYCTLDMHRMLHSNVRMLYSYVRGWQYFFFWSNFFLFTHAKKNMWPMIRELAKAVLLRCHNIHFSWKTRNNNSRVIIITYSNLKA